MQQTPTGCMEAVDLSDGTVLITEGEPQPWLFHLVEGQIRACVATEDGPVTVGRLQAPAWLGEIGFVDGDTATATVVCEGAVSVLRLHRDTLPSLMAASPAGASALLRQVNQALAARLSEAAVGELDARDDGSFGIRRADPPSRLRRIIGKLWDVR